MSFEDEKLVDLIKKNDILWNKNRQDFRLSAQKDAKWKEIAAELESTRECCLRLYLLKSFFTSEFPINFYFHSVQGN